MPFAMFVFILGILFSIPYSASGQTDWEVCKGCDGNWIDVTGQMAEMDGCAVVGTPTMCFSYCCSGGPMKQSCKKEFGRIDCSEVTEPTTEAPTTKPPTTKPPTKKPKPEKCYNLRPKRQCRKVLMSGRCAKPYWRVHCCISCGGCGNLWTKKRCGRLSPYCRRSALVRKNCKKTCKRC